MTFSVPPPVYATGKIKAMKANTDIFLASAQPSSIKAIASRLGKAMRRVYRTKTEHGGVRVWRHK